MSKHPIIVSLVSEQAAPNILFAIDYINSNPGNYDLLLFSTEKMEKVNASENLTKTIRLSCGNFIGDTRTLVISHDNYEEIGAVLKKTISNKDEYIVNITGGTKIMSIAVYEYFINNNFTVKPDLYYLTLGKNSYARLYPKHDIKKIDKRLAIEEYLTAYGISYKVTKDKLQSMELNRTFAREIFPKYRKLIESLVQLQNDNHIKDKLSKKGFFDFTSEKALEKMEKYKVDKSELAEFFGLLGYNMEEIKSKQLRYVTGGWFEEFTYQKIKEEQEIPEGSISINVKIGVEAGSPGNELDILYINDRNGLSIVECKSSIGDRIITNTFYKMAAIKKDFGLQARSYLYTMSVIEKDTYKLRAKNLNITIKDARDIMEE